METLLNGGQPESKRKTGFLVPQLIILLLPQLLSLAFSRGSRKIIKARAGNRSELSGRMPTMANRTDAAHKPYAQFLDHGNMLYDDPASGIFLLQDEHAMQHLQLAEDAHTLRMRLNNLTAARLTLERMERDTEEAMRQYGDNYDPHALPEWT